MPDVRHLRGQARRSRSLLSAALADTREATRVHISICAQCKRAGVKVYERCDEGWLLIKQETRQRNALAKYDDRHEDGQQALEGI